MNHWIHDWRNTPDCPRLDPPVSQANDVGRYRIDVRASDVCRTLLSFQQSKKQREEDGTRTHVVFRARFGLPRNRFHWFVRSVARQSQSACIIGWFGCRRKRGLKPGWLSVTCFRPPIFSTKKKKCVVCSSRLTLLACGEVLRGSGAATDRTLLTAISDSDGPGQRRTLTKVQERWRSRTLCNLLGPLCLWVMTSMECFRDSVSSETMVLQHTAHIRRR